MAFSEKIKLDVKKRAAFRCCRCHEIGIDIHHMVPQAKGGSDDIDNAAPLCQNCHDRFGANPEKQKEIRQMRDWWYDIVIEKYGEDSGSKRIEEINELVLQIQKNDEERDEDINKLKIELQDLQKDSLGGLSSGSVQQLTGYYISATRLSKGVYSNFHCGKCNYSIAFLVTDSDKCPNCQTIIE